MDQIQFVLHLLCIRAAAQQTAAQQHTASSIRAAEQPAGPFEEVIRSDLNKNLNLNWNLRTSSVRAAVPYRTAGVNSFQHLAHDESKHEAHML